MAKEFYIRFRTAGRYCLVTRYSRPLPGDSEAARTAKQAATTAAQKFINIKNATERLQLLLCANFDSKEASFCTFTFTDETLPANRKHAKAIFADYLRRLRPEWKRAERPFKYLYTIEGEPLSVFPSAAPVAGQRWEVAPWREEQRWEQLDTAAQDAPEPPTRFHVHCFFLLRKTDYETVKALWPYGQVYISQMKVNDLTTFQRLASYVTKESRAGTKGNGERAYTPSLNLEQPTIDGHWCSEFEGIKLPLGAEKISSGTDSNEIYGSSMEYLFYRMPRPVQQPQPYKSKGQLVHKKRRSQRP
ncbi:MAG: hypothetical protein IJB59_11475 [Oscillospiraceae bacterium]|nr:hypothetical protein [Oscillospiraceae bacterium]